MIAASALVEFLVCLVTGPPVMDWSVLQLQHNACKAAEQRCCTCTLHNAACSVNITNSLWSHQTTLICRGSHRQNRRVDEDQVCTGVCLGAVLWVCDLVSGTTRLKWLLQIAKSVNWLASVSLYGTCVVGHAAVACSLLRGHDEQAV